MGDACGIGPEIIAAFCRSADAAGCVVVGDVAVMRRAAALTGGALPVAQVERVADAAALPPLHRRCCRSPGCRPISPPRRSAGSTRAPAPRRRAASSRRSRWCARRGGALVTAPIHKEAFAAAGIGYPGHTEMLQALAAAGGALPPVRMMLANDELKTVLVTIHMALRQAIEAVTFDAVLTTIRIAHAAARPSARRSRASPSPASIRTPAKAACSATRRCA